VKTAPTHPNKSFKFAPRGQPRSYDTPVEEAGEAIVAKIRRAAELANETCDRAMKLAHKLSLELRAAEDRINQLEAEVQLFRDRAARAEGWLQTIYKEIEEKLIAPSQPPEPNRDWSARELSAAHN
jgi:hypothetical protein